MGGNSKFKSNMAGKWIKLTLLKTKSTNSAKNNTKKILEEKGPSRVKKKWIVSFFS